MAASKWFADRQESVAVFGAVNPAKNVTVARTGRVARQPGDVERVRNTMTYSAKATWQATSDHRIDVSFFGDPSKGDNGPQRIRAARSGYLVVQRAHLRRS
jgi:hypothetical protein